MSCILLNLTISSMKYTDKLYTKKHQTSPKLNVPKIVHKNHQNIAPKIKLPLCRDPFIGSSLK